MVGHWLVVFTGSTFVYHALYHTFGCMLVHHTDSLLLCFIPMVMFVHHTNGIGFILVHCIKAVILYVCTSH